jgi:putative pyruvate formate lyase activating enzyme
MNMEKNTPGYLQLLQTGELKKRINELKAEQQNCCLCPHQCRIDRPSGKKGVCRAGPHALIDGYGPHFGEERELVGEGGSGTIFFTHCTLKCVFCQNCEISCYGEGSEVDVPRLVHIFLSLQSQGCHNINLVSPTHYVPQIVEAVFHAAGQGLQIPIVYNTGGYERLETLQKLEGVIDIYMPDIKFGDNEKARKYTGVKDYFDMARAAVREMHRQTGDLKTDDRGIARRGLLIRHLVLPNRLADTETVMAFIAREISKDTVVNIMAQYHPAHKARQYKELSRRVSRAEYEEAVKLAGEYGLHRIIAESI